MKTQNPCCAPYSNAHDEPLLVCQLPLRSYFIFHGICSMNVVVMAEMKLREVDMDERSTGDGNTWKMGKVMTNDKKLLVQTNFIAELQSTESLIQHLLHCFHTWDLKLHSQYPDLRAHPAFMTLASIFEGCTPFPRLERVLQLLLVSSFVANCRPLNLVERKLVRNRKGPGSLPLNGLDKGAVSTWHLLGICSFRRKIVAVDLLLLSSPQASQSP